MASNKQREVALPVYSAKLGLFYDIGNHQNVRKKHPRNTNAFHAFSKSSLDGKALAEFNNSILRL
jgi:hypothetical protein